MSNISSLIRKLDTIPKNLNYLHPIYLEILDSYYGSDYKKINYDNYKLEYYLKNTINRYELYNNCTNNCWSLTVSRLLPKHKIINLSPSHIKVLSGSLNCKNKNFMLNLKNGSITIPYEHILINNNPYEETVFFSIHSLNNFKDFPLL